MHTFHSQSLPKAKECPRIRREKRKTSQGLEGKLRLKTRWMISLDVVSLLAGIHVHQPLLRWFPNTVIAIWMCFKMANRPVDSSQAVPDWETSHKRPGDVQPLSHVRQVLCLRASLFALAFVHRMNDKMKVAGFTI